MTVAVFGVMLVLHALLNTFGIRIVKLLNDVSVWWHIVGVSVIVLVTVFLNQHTSPALRALRTDRTNALEFDTETNAMGLFANAMDLYFGGDMEAAVALSGQVAGRIDEIRPVADIISECARDCLAMLADLAKRYPVA